MQREAAIVSSMVVAKKRGPQSAGNVIEAVINIIGNDVTNDWLNIIWKQQTLAFLWKFVFKSVKLQSVTFALLENRF